MILATVLVKITRSLEILIENEGQGVSSHGDAKTKSLKQLLNFLDKAPETEYITLLKDKDHSILIGYNLNILCRIASSDKSRYVRTQSLESIRLLVRQLLALHEQNIDTEPCSVQPLIQALPGIVSALIKLIMSDTKLPKTLLTTAIRTLSDFLEACFTPCSHHPQISEDDPSLLYGDNLIETCDNLATRLQLLIKYIIDQGSLIPVEVKCEALELCKVIVYKTGEELLSRMLKSVVKYIAFMSALDESDSKMKSNVELTIMIITDKVRDMIGEKGTNCDKLETVIMTTVIELLNSLEKDYTTMLISERLSILSMFYGLLRMLPDISLTTLFELPDKRDQITRTLIDLAQFANNQPFLFLTDSQVSDQAIENPIKIYSVEKRFSHLSSEEIVILRKCCTILGSNIDWRVISDILRDLAKQFESSSSLFIAQLILCGCASRGEDSTADKIAKFSTQLFIHYLDQLNEEYHIITDNLEEYDSIESESVLKMVIAVESLISLLELHYKFSRSEDEKILMLKPLLCPLLNWSSTSNRAISEASLGALSQVSHIHGHNSIKSLIETNIDYIVDGIGTMLNSYVLDPEITSVLALTLKLSSIETLYYFRDIYEKVFKLLAAYHESYFSTSIALLFYRTLNILADWRSSTNEAFDEAYRCPLEDPQGIKRILRDLDVRSRKEKLEKKLRMVEQVNQKLDELYEKVADENEVLNDLNEGKLPTGYEDRAHEASQPNEPEVEKPYEVALTEKIMQHTVNLISSNFDETKILALKTATQGFRVLCNDENALLPLVHKVWSPLVSRLTSDYSKNLEVNLCAFECLVAMALFSKDFIKSRTLDLIIPRICTFLESQARSSRDQKDYGPYCMTMVYKCQLRMLSNIGPLAYHIQLAYSALWRVVKVTLLYLDANQIPSLRKAAHSSLLFMMALDADCVWYHAKTSQKLADLPFERIFLA